MTVKQRLGADRDARDTIRARRKAAEGADADDTHRPHREYSQRRGGRYDSDEDRSRSVSPDPQGPRAFGPRVHAARFPPHFRAPSTVPKYDGETNPNVWLDYYRLACRAGGAQDDFFIIKNLPLHLTDSARTWLEHLPRGRIDSWAELRKAFIGNFQGTYARPGNQWELRNCK